MPRHYSVPGKRGPKRSGNSPARGGRRGARRGGARPAKMKGMNPKRRF